MPAAQFPFALRHLVLRMSGDPERLVPAVRGEILAIDPNQPITDARTMTDIVNATLGAARLHTRILVLFAAIAMGLVQPRGRGLGSTRLNPCGIAEWSEGRQNCRHGIPPRS
jgi:hypothetical protein